MKSPKCLTKKLLNNINNFPVLVVSEHTDEFIDVKFIFDSFKTAISVKNKGLIDAQPFKIIKNSGKIVDVLDILFL